MCVGMFACGFDYFGDLVTDQFVVGGLLLNKT